MASLTILFLFLAEALALILALGPSKFFRSPFYVLDIFVVSASIAFDFSDTVHREVGQCWRGGGAGDRGGNLTCLCCPLAALRIANAKAGLLILPRLWRCARVVHGVYMASHMEVRARDASYIAALCSSEVRVLAYSQIEQAHEKMHERMQEEHMLEKSAAHKLMLMRELLPDEAEAMTKGQFATKQVTIPISSALLLRQHIDQAIAELELAADADPKTPRTSESSVGKGEPSNGNGSTQTAIAPVLSSNVAEA